MQLRNRIFAAILIPAAVLSIALPAVTLFTGDGFLAPYIRTPEAAKMLAEIAVLLLLSGGIFFLIKNKGRQAAAAALLGAAFCWLHVVFLPMVLSALYLGFLVLAGRFLREKVFGIEDHSGYPADFLLGSSAVILLFCLLSAAGAGRIPVMQFICAAAGLVLYACYGAKLYKERGRKELLFTGSIPRGDIDCRTALYSGAVNSDRKEKAADSAGRGSDRKTGSFGRFFYPGCYTLIFTAFLIQAGRMNIALDFDTLWYGVRSEYILAGGAGIYENPGLVGMVYVYSKGLEVLTLPLSDLASHSYLLFFTLWLAVMGLMMVYRIARLFMGREYSVLAAALCASLPAIMNMGISAKPDIITWLLQLIMIEYFFRYLISTGAGEDRNGKGSGRGDVTLLILSVGAYLLSLTMKPTSLIFSTAVFGMMGIYLIGWRRLSFRASLRHWASTILPGAALAGIWARTMMITGMPVTSVFTSIFAKLGFEMKYPFATGSLPQNWQDESNLHVLLRRLWQMLLSPEGKDMGHVIIAWGTSLLFFLVLFIAVSVMMGAAEKKERGGITTAAAVIFWPFLAVNLISLVMLYQVDGNYFMLLYTFLVLIACRKLSGLAQKSAKGLVILLLVPLLGFNILLTAQTNWAWSVGFSEIRPVNKGRYNHKAKQHEDMIIKGNAAIWQILAADPENRVIAFGDHPFCLQFPCNVQSYKDITSPWGNVELVNSPEAFEEYMEYAGTDYVYAESGYIGTDSWEWSYGLLRDRISDGVLTDFFFENGNMLARYSREKLPGEKAAENLRLFDENYITSDMVKQEVKENE